MIIADRDVIISNSIVGLMMFTSLWWVCINVPEYFNHAVVYMFALLAYIVFSVTRVLPSYGFNTENIHKQILIGIGVSIVVALPVLLTQVTSTIASIAILSLSPVSVFFIVFVAPLVEEMFFRGLLLPLLSEKFGIIIAIVITAVVFAVFHYGVYGVNVNSIIWLIVLSVMLGFITVYTQSLIPAIILHMANNSVSVLHLTASIISWSAVMGLTLAFMVTVVALLAYHRFEKIMMIAIVLGVLGAVVSAYTIIVPFYDLNMYGELSALSLIAITIPLALLVLTLLSETIGAPITDRLACATVVVTAMVSVLVGLYVGTSIPTIVLGVMLGVGIALFIEVS